MGRQTPATFTIEPATEEDWPWIAEGQVEIAWVGLTSERQESLGRQRVEESVARQVERLRSTTDFPNQAFVARTDDGTPAGYVWVARDENDSTGQLEASLLSQFVAQAYRGQGLGRRLMEAAEAWARQQSLPRIGLSIGARNTLGQRLYESLGFRIETLRMTKKLGPSEADDDIHITDD